MPDALMDSAAPTMVAPLPPGNRLAPVAVLAGTGLIVVLLVDAYGTWLLSIVIWLNRSESAPSPAELDRQTHQLHLLSGGYLGAAFITALACLALFIAPLVGRLMFTGVLVGLAASQWYEASVAHLETSGWSGAIIGLAGLVAFVAWAPTVLPRWSWLWPASMA